MKKQVKGNYPPPSVKDLHDAAYLAFARRGEIPIPAGLEILLPRGYKASPSTGKCECLACRGKN